MSGRTRHDPQRRMLETLLDRMGLKGTVELLAILCEEKGNHVASNWQDMTLAEGWNRDAGIWTPKPPSWRLDQRHRQNVGEALGSLFLCLALRSRYFSRLSARRSYERICWASCSRPSLNGRCSMQIASKASNIGLAGPRCPLSLFEFIPPILLTPLLPMMSALISFSSAHSDSS